MCRKCPHWRNNHSLHSSSHQIYASGKNLGEFCGKQRPLDLDTSSNEVDLLFFTDESGDSRGWKLHYTTESERFRVECGLLGNLYLTCMRPWGSVSSLLNQNKMSEPLPCLPVMRETGGGTTGSDKSMPSGLTNSHQVPPTQGPG